MRREFTSGAPYRRLAPTLASANVVAGRCIPYAFSDESVGRDNHVIAADAWRSENFKMNPMFLWAHDANSPPVGRVTEIGTRGKKLVGTVEYADRDASEFADTVFRLVKGGYLNATSTSWLPIDWKYSTDRSRPGGVDFSKVEMLEVSQVPVPALPTALATARAAGINIEPLGIWAASAIDRGDVMPKGELEMIRRAAGVARLYSPGAAIAPQPRAATAARSPSPFPTFGHFAHAVALAGQPAAAPDARLVRASTGGNETDPTAGGFLVPDAFEDQLIGSIYEEAVLAPLVDCRETDRPSSWKLPAVNETSRADGSRWGGVESYWTGEAVQPQESLPRFKLLDFSAKTLIALCTTTAELVSDVPLLDGHLRRAFASEGAFKLDLAILLGTGAGVPLGICNAPATIVVPKKNGQASATIVAENIADMWSRLPGPSRKRAVWIVNEYAEAALDQSGSTPSTAGMYFPAGTGGNLYALIKGRPILLAEQCPLLGTPGDIVLADLSQYILVDGGFKMSASADVSFDTDEIVFRFKFRGDGMPNLAKPVTPYNGGLARSPFVTLAQR